MRLSWFEGSGPDARPCTVADLETAGVFYRHLSTDPARYEPALAELGERCGYIARDEVMLSPETPNLDGLLGKFRAEHLHTEDEVRFVLAGEGIFDIRSVDDRWMRVVVEAGDLLVVPKDRHHRFLLTEQQAIRCVRLFQDPAGWTPVYRSPAA